MNQQVISALLYLQSLLDKEGFEHMAISVTPKKIEVVRNYDFKDVTEISGDINPIQDILTHINKEMCVECLSQNYNFRDPFFVSLAEAYVDSLIHEHGPRVPISKALAKAIVIYELSDCEVHIENRSFVIVLDESTVALLDADYVGDKIYLVAAEVSDVPE